MARGIIRKIVGTGGIGAGLTAAGTAFSNALGPEGRIDSNMPPQLVQHIMENWQPTDVGQATIVGGVVGIGVGAYNRYQEFKKEQEGHNERNLNQNQFKDY